MSDKFFVDYSNTSFLETSKTVANTNRLNWQCEILLTRNREAIKDKRVLDLASHDGRFSYACLKLGAKHVTGVEIRPHLVKYAKENLVDMGYNAGEFDFIKENVFDYLHEVKPGEFDTILCIGFFYHTIKQIELLMEISRIQPKYFILDTMIADDLIERKINVRSVFNTMLILIKRIRFEDFIQLGKSIKRLKNVLGYYTKNEYCGYLAFKFEDNTLESSTIDAAGLVAWPTKSFIELFFKRHGFDFKQLQWSKKEVRDWSTLEDYQIGKRVSYIARLESDGVVR